MKSREKDISTGREVGRKMKKIALATQLGSQFLGYVSSNISQAAAERKLLVVFTTMPQAFPALIIDIVVSWAPHEGHRMGLLDHCCAVNFSVQALNGAVTGDKHWGFPVATAVGKFVVRRMATTAKSFQIVI